MYATLCVLACVRGPTVLCRGEGNEARLPEIADIMEEDVPCGHPVGPRWLFLKPAFCPWVFTGNRICYCLLQFGGKLKLTSSNLTDNLKTDFSRFWELALAQTLSADLDGKLF